MSLPKDKIHVTPARLWISGSQKCVSVEGGSSPLLVTQSHQDESKGRVQVCEMWYGARRCMAFRFEVEDKVIFPFVDDKDIKFEELSSKQEVTLDEKFLFQWGERKSNDYRSLESVAKPSMFLCAEDNENKVTIKPNRKQHFKIEIKGETQTSDREVFHPKKLNMKTPNERSAKTARKGETQTSDREVFHPKKLNMKTPYERSAKTARKGETQTSDREVFHPKKTQHENSVRKVSQDRKKRKRKKTQTDAHEKLQ